MLSTEIQELKQYLKRQLYNSPFVLLLHRLLLLTKMPSLAKIAKEDFSQSIPPQSSPPLQSSPLPLALYTTSWTSGNLNAPGHHSIDGARLFLAGLGHQIRPSSSALQSGGMPYLAGHNGRSLSRASNASETTRRFVAARQALTQMHGSVSSMGLPIPTAVGGSLSAERPTAHGR